MKAAEDVVTISPNSTQRRKKVKHWLNSKSQLDSKDRSEAHVRVLYGDTFMDSPQPPFELNAGNNEEAIAPRFAPCVR
jgi:hypothetical protein